MERKSHKALAPWVEKDYRTEEGVMKKLVLLFSILFIFTSIILTQEVIENPQKPLSKNAGRVLRLEEELRITDESGEFYFKYLRNLKVAPNGSIFVVDVDQLLQFNSAGNFIQNFFKKGQGPGELSSISDYFFQNKNVIIHDRRLNKILWFDFKGKLINEFRIYEQSGLLRFQLFYNNTYYFFKSGFPDTGGKPTLVDSPQVLVAMTQDKNEIKELISFPIKIFAMGAQGGGGFVGVSRLITTPYKDKYLFISHNREYLLKLYDVKSQKILRSFKRDYKRIKTPKDYRGGGFTIGGKGYSPPRPEYMSDVNNLFVFNELLWIMTSTKDEEKGYLIDVFNVDGKFIDSFYLNLNGRFIATHKDSIFVREEDEDGNVQIIKYRIIE